MGGDALPGEGDLSLRQTRFRSEHARLAAERALETGSVREQEAKGSTLMESVPDLTLPHLDIYRRRQHEEKEIESTRPFNQPGGTSCYPEPLRATSSEPLSPKGLSYQASRFNGCAAAPLLTAVQANVGVV